MGGSKTPASTLLIELARHGIEIQPHGDRLRSRPRSAMTPDLIERVRLHKSDLLAILAADQNQLRPKTTAGEWRTYHLTLVQRWTRDAKMCRLDPEAAAGWRWRADRHRSLAAGEDQKNSDILVDKNMAGVISCPT